MELQSFSSIYLKESFKHFFSTVPFWSVKNISEASESFEFTETLSYATLISSYGDLFWGTKVSDCLLPCRRTTLEVTAGPVSRSKGNYSFLSIGFSHSMEVKTITVDKFSFMFSLNLLGSNLGLWPGLGLYQIFELFLGKFFIYRYIYNKICSLQCAKINK